MGEGGGVRGERGGLYKMWGSRKIGREKKFRTIHVATFKLLPCVRWRHRWGVWQVCCWKKTAGWQLQEVYGGPFLLELKKPRKHAHPRCLGSASAFIVLSQQTARLKLFIRNGTHLQDQLRNTDTTDRNAPFFLLFLVIFLVLILIVIFDFFFFLEDYEYLSLQYFQSAHGLFHDRINFNFMTYL